MPSSVSFLQAASAKLSASPTQSPSLQLLLAEDESKTLSYSLAMDAAYSLVSSSPSMKCRGCGFSEQNCCRCCKVAMLVTQWKDTTATNQQNLGQEQNNRKKDKNVTDMPFPLRCYQEGMDSNNDKSRERDQSALDQIQIRYVNSIEDVLRYLIYAPSLPQHLIPMEGIFLLGLGDLISRESARIMELTNILSILSDTGFVLDKLRSEGSNSSSTSQTTTLVATLNQQIYSSLPQTVYKQLGFSVASSVQQKAPNANTNTCELVFEDSPSRNSFTFTNYHDEEIIWSV
mmetsp:Transcript_19328/g.30235  ORF Transcript_19328/g.30235 Transcript_19328/m.30235 type:complete len:288 (-) Transcript_19328:1103-1966(-)